MATFYGNKGQYTDKQIRDFIGDYYTTPKGKEDIQYLVNQGLIRPSDDPGVLTQRAAYYGLTQILGMPESEASSAMAAVFPKGTEEDVNRLASLYEQSMITGVPTSALQEAAAKVGLSSTDSFDIQRILENRGSTNSAVVSGTPSSEAIIKYGPDVEKTGEGNLIFSPSYNPAGSDTNRYDLAKSIVEAPDAAAKAKAIELANAQQAAMNAAAQAEAQAKADKVMSDRAQAMALGLPPSTDMSGLSALSKYDFSKAAPQLRMAGTYTNPLLMPTKAGSPGVAPTYTPERAPTREEAFMRYAFPDGVAGATDIEDNITRGLQFARNLGLDPTETLGLINRALPAGQSITPAQLQAAVEPRAGLLALAQPRVGPSVSFRREFGKVSDIPIRNVADEIANPAGAGVVKGGSGAYGIDIVSPSLPGQTRDEFAEGGAIHYAAGDVVKAGEKAYTLADFGISTPSVAGTLSVPRNVVFNKALEAAEKGKVRTGLSDLIDLQNLAIRQGRTDRDYIDLLSRVADSYGYSPSQFGRIEARGPATSDIRTYNPYYFAEGGDVGRGLGSIAMKGYAQEMAQKGRFGDTMLAHISPEEAQMLQAAGGAGTINPETGLPEYFSWRKVLKGVAKVAPFVVPFIPGLGLAAKALISGVAGGLGGQKGFDFKRGLMSGLMSYGIGSAAQNLGLTSGAAPTGAEAVAPQAAIDTAKAVTDPNVMGGSAMFQAPQGYGTSMMDFPSTPSFEASSTVPSDFAKEIMTPSMPTSDLGSFNASPGTPPVTEPSALDTIKAKISPSLEKAQTVLDKPIDTLYAVPMALSSAAMVSEGDKAAQAIAAQQEEEDRKKRLGAQLFAETLGRVPVRGASGGMAGIGALAAGGATGSANEPRTINGAGDGMSDSVPATIEGIQEARLADGEFVIPADVVADLGNGSSNAGSKKLYAMMDRVRKARHGTTRQPPEVDMGRLMPA